MNTRELAREGDSLVPGRFPCSSSPPPFGRVFAAEPVKPICLPFFDEELDPGTPLWVTGWGYTKENGESAPILWCR